MILQNKFEIIASRMMQYGMREGVKVRRQEITEEVKCFRYWGVRHFKWECPNIEVEKRKKGRKRWYMWLDYKRHNKRGDQCIPHGKRHRSTVKRRMRLQKVHSYLREDR